MATKKTTKKVASHAPARETKAQASARTQVEAVILFAVAILLFCIAILKGEAVWTFLHNAMLGIFSFSAYLLPLIFAFVAVMLALEKEHGSVSGRVWESTAFVVMLNSLIYVCTETPTKGEYFRAIGAAFVNGGEHKGGGVLGVLLGHPIERMLGNTGAIIVLVLLMVVFFMLVTGTTIVALMRILRRPVDKTKETIEHAINQTGERFEEAQKRHPQDIDIDLGDGYPGSRRRKKAEDIVIDDEPAPIFPAPIEEPPIEPISEVKLADLKEKVAAVQKEEKEPIEEVDTFPETMVEGDEPVYRFPPLTLLDEGGGLGTLQSSETDRRATGQLLVNTLRDFGINTRLTDITCGPAVTRYELEPSAGVKISRITGLADDISLRLATTGVRIEAPIPNKAAVGIEVPNKSRRTVCLRSLLDTEDYRTAKGKLTVALGQDIEGNVVLADLAKMPHLLIAGTTGSGKSVCTNSMIQSVLFRATPEEVKLILIDPKKVEFGVYNGVPHLLIPVVTDPRKAAGALGWAVNEMLKRYQMFAEANVRDIASYNEFARKDETDAYKPLPLILIVIDELADLMMAAANEVEDSICRLAQMARAAGMHMVIATQRPSVDVITGLIKANIPSRLALTVASAVDSRTILDTGGAERLLGYGDMLFMPVGQSKPRRVQGCFVTNQEVERIIDFLKTSEEPREYSKEITDEIEKLAAATGRASSKAASEEDDGADDDWDEALPQAIEIAVDAGQISTSMLQRKLRFGYARAGRIIDQMETRGIIGPSEGSKPRKVLLTRQQWIEMNMNATEETE